MQDNTLFLEVVSPSGILFEGNVISFSVATINGIITVLPHHASIFTKLAEGELEINIKNSHESIYLGGGFLEVENNRAHILSDHAFRAESIELAKAQERKRILEESLKQKETNAEITSIDKDLKKSILELKVAEKLRRRSRINSS